MNISKKITVLLCLCLAIAGKVYGAAAPNYDEASISDLIYACDTGNCDEVEKLLAHGISPDARNEYGETALISAAAKGHKDVVNILLAHKANINTIGHQDGSTPLMCAATWSHTDVVKILLAHGAALDVVDKNGLTALTWAKDMGRTNIVELLLQASAQKHAAQKRLAEATGRLKKMPEMTALAAEKRLAEAIAKLEKIDEATARAEKRAAEATATLEAEKRAAVATARLEAEKRLAEERAQKEVVEAMAEMRAAKATARLEAEKRAAEARAEKQVTEATAKLEADKQVAKTTARLELAEAIATLEAEKRADEATATLEAEKQVDETTARLEAQKEVAEATARLAAEKTARLEADKAMDELVAQEEREKVKKAKERPAAAAKKLATKVAEATNAQQASKTEQPAKLAAQKKQAATKKPTTSNTTEIVSPATKPTEKVDVEKTEAQKQQDEQKRLERAEKQAAKAIADQKKIAAEQAIAEQKKIEAETATLVEQETKREKKQLKRAAKKSAAEQQQAIAAEQDAADELSRPQRAGKQAATRADKECPICLDDIEGDNGAQLTCGHETCRDCAQKIIEVALLEGNGNARCSIAKCRMLLGQNDIKTICGDNIALQTRYDILLNESFIFKKAGRTVDPSQEEDIRTITCHECKGIFSIIPQEEFQQKTRLCGNKQCKARFCGRCYLPFHKGLSCAHATQQAEAHKAEEGAAPVVESNEIKLCPTCDFSVLKEGEGCNFVICSRCPEWEWCWYCKKRFKIKINEQTRLKLPKQGHKEHLCADGQLIHTAYGLTLQEARERIKAKQSRS